MTTSKVFSVALTVDGVDYTVNGTVSAKGKVVVEELGMVTERTEEDEFCTWLVGDQQAAFLKANVREINKAARAVVA